MTSVSKNQLIQVKCVDYTSKGEGVVKIDNYPLFVPGFIPGEEGMIKVLKVGKSFGYGKVVDLLKESPHRVGYSSNTGLDVIHLSYEEQLRFKRMQVEKALRKIGNIDVEVNPVLGMEYPFAYRNKAQIPIRDVGGTLETGFFRRNSHDLVPVDDFVIQQKELDKAIIIIRETLKELKYKGYHEERKKGLFSYMLLRRGFYTKELMVVLVTKEETIPQVDELIRKLRKRLPEMVSLLQSIQKSDTNVILGGRQRLLFGREVYREKLDDLTFFISPKSFFQVNTQQTEVLYKKALEMLDPKEEDIILDAYCGIGTISLFLAKKVKHVYGIEVISDAVAMARENAEANKVDNVTFYGGDVTKLISSMDHITGIVVDPPRKGLSREVIEEILRRNLKKVLYISCNPATLARDLNLLSEKYNVVEVQPVDLFPQTHHVETIVLLSRGNITEYNL